MQGRILQLQPSTEAQTLVGKVTYDPTIPAALRPTRILASREVNSPPPEAYIAAISLGDSTHAGWIQAVSGCQLGEGDVVRVDLALGRCEVIYRRGSDHNTLLLTERCNCDCVMCVQPPRKSDDRLLLSDYLQAIPLMDRDIRTLGLSGGEPTLLKSDLVKLVRFAASHLPETRFHLLSNARLFRYLKFARDLAEAAQGRLTVGIPLNSDVPSDHDAICRSKGAFDETILGALSLHRCGVAVEIRVVLTRPVVHRLPGIARFIQRNLPFVCHVAFMGMELVGNAVENVQDLWIEPQEFARELSEAVTHLDTYRIPVSVFNLQLCLLDPSLRRFAERSISDWKVDYPPECKPCTQRNSCCGFFGTDEMYGSSSVKPILE